MDENVAGVSRGMEETVRELAALAEEPLLPELEEYLDESEAGFGTMLRHPLVYQVPLTLPGLANRSLRAKEAALEDALEEEDWHSVIWLHERPYRTKALIDYVVGRGEDWRSLPLADCSQEVRDLAASVWTDSENLGQNADEWDDLLRHADGLVLASEEERLEFASLPDVLTVYRAGIDDGGWSWTLDPKIAEFFSKRFGEHAPMIQGTVDKADVIGYLTRRSEAEVLVPLGSVRDIRPYAADA